MSAETLRDDGHPGEWQLRRLRAGELAGEALATLEAHTAACSRCRARLGVLGEEQRQFERDIPFDRFAGGVGRAVRVPGPARVAPPRGARRRAFFVLPPLLAVAAALVLVVRPRGPGSPDAGSNTLKGAAVAAELRIADARGAQRALSAGATARLAPGDRLRLGYRSDRARHLVALSIDDQGATTPLYPERGPALAVAASAALVYLPDSIELDGKGHERIYLLLADAAFTVEQAAAAVTAERTRTRGDLATMGVPALPTQGLHAQSWLLAKP